MDAIAVSRLVMQYGPLRAVDGVELTIEQGETFALVGPNGAGKTTTIEVLEGYRKPTSGTVTVLGEPPVEAGRGLRERVGIMLQEAGFDELSTVRELVTLYAGFYPRRRQVDELLESVGIAAKAKARVGTLSGGQRRRLDLALALAGDPEVLFLDEPTTGFDPAARRQAWHLVDGLRGAGKTVLLTTHYMDEAEYLADRIGIMVAGRLVAVGTPDELRRDAGVTAVLSFQIPVDVAASELPGLSGLAHVDGRDVEVATVAPTADAHTLTGWALERGLTLPGLQLREPSIEDVYLQLTQLRHG
ncbi:MAG: ABC transporter ATP-binding protein [Dermatophilaceae bacterium]